MSSTSYSRPEGCEDHDGAATLRRRTLEARLLEVFAGYGYEEVSLPTLEYADLYHPARLGSDLFHQLLTCPLSEAELFATDREGAEEGAPVAGRREAAAVLRPEFTASVARWFVGRVVEGGRPAYLPARVAYAGQIFRNLEPAPGRLKEFRQVGVELIGAAHPWGDREVLCLACDTARALGLAGWKLHLGHARLYREILRSYGLGSDRLSRVANNLEIAARILARAEAPDEVFANYVCGFLRAHRSRFPADHPGVLDCARLSVAEWRRELPALHDGYLERLWRGPEFGLDAAAVEDLLAVARLGREPEGFFAGLGRFVRSAEAEKPARELEELAAWVQRERHLEPLITAASRGLAYYTGLTFEIHCPLGSSPYTDVCGGGHYEDLYGWVYRRTLATQAVRSGRAAPPMASAEEVLPGVGLAFGLERVGAALSAPGERPATAQVFVAVLAPELADEAFRLAARLRGRGLSVECHLPTPQAGVGAREQIGHADRIGAPFVVLLGPDEWRQGRVGLRDMRARRQTEATPDEALGSLVRALAAGA